MFTVRLRPLPHLSPRRHGPVAATPLRRPPRTVRFALIRPQARLRWGSGFLRMRPVPASTANPSSPPVEAERDADAEGVLFRETFAVQRTETVAGKVTVRLKKGGAGRSLTVGCNIDGKWLLHWGVTYCDDISSEWDQPPLEIRPPGSVPIKDYAIETPFKKSSSNSEGHLHEVQINLDDNSSIAAINFVLKEEETGSWYQHKGRDFRIPLIDFQPDNDTGVGGQKGFSIWPGALTQISSLLLKSESDKSTSESTDEAKDAKVEVKPLDRYSEEFPLLKEIPVQNSITVTVINGEVGDKNNIQFDTDVPGVVIIHWGVCKGGTRKWEVPSPPHPPQSKIFRRSALQTLLQQKTDVVGNHGSFPLDKDVTGVFFVLKLSEYSWLNNMGSDFYIPLVCEDSLSTQIDMGQHETIQLEEQLPLKGFIDSNKELDVLQLTEKEITEEVAIESSREKLPDIFVTDEAQERQELSYTDDIINDIRSLVTDISFEKSMSTKSKEAQESILQEIEKLAAEAYSIFRTSSPIFVEELASQVESLKPSVPISSGTGTGYEILCQGFNWESNKSGRWYSDLALKASELAQFGITTIWLPPPTESVSPEGYMPKDLYNLNSRYGTIDELKNVVSALHDVGIKVLGDVVLNHRCAHYQNKNGVWNIFGGRLNWDDRAIVSDDPHFQGRGNKSSGDHFHAAPNIDHSQEFVRRDLKEWLCWLREEIGYDGWRLDFARGFWGGYVKDYLEATAPFFAVGEYWDSLSYTYGQMDYNQDAHRQRIVDWINATNGTAGAFDVTTKGILHAALEKCEYWRLADEKGKPPGVLGWWPSRAVTFIENHDTGSTQGHWRFPAGHEMQGYAYILTHPGTPTVFYDHLYSHYQHEIARLISLRTRMMLHCRSTVKILKCHADVYAAEIDENVTMKIGPGHFEPGGGKRWSVAAEGRDYKVWEAN